MLMRTFNGMFESYPLFMSVGFVRHHSPFAISYIWFTTTPGCWFSDTASPAVKSQMFHFTLFLYGDWNARSGLSVQTKHFHVFSISLKRGTFLAPIFGEEWKLWSSSLRNFFCSSITFHRSVNVLSLALRSHLSWKNSLTIIMRTSQEEKSLLWKSVSLN